jgi:hypothetical protein
MNTKTRFILVLTLALLMGAALWATLTQAAPGAAPLAQGGAPAVVSYQGEVRVDGDPYDDPGYFKFAVVNAAGTTTYWSNDGTSTGGGEPTAAVQLAVSDGLFSVLLGDTTLGGMTQALTADVFSQPNRYLRVWFSSDNTTFDQLTPDTRIAAVPYALQAERVRGYAGVVIVAQSGGDYTSVQAAIDSITDATADNPYLVWVAPGVYSETVTMKPYVHLQGAGQEATIITSTVSSSGVWLPTQATLVLASDVSLRDLTVGNGGAGDANAALLATAGMTRTLAADVTARALGGGVNNVTILLSGSGTGVTLQQVTALAENGSGLNSGLVNHNGAAAMLRGGVFTGRGGDYAWAIFTRGSGTTLEAENVSALGENAITTTFGLYNFDSTLTALGVTALAENGTENYAMGNYNVATATLIGGVFTARGGVNNYALSNELTVTLKAVNVTSLAENGSGDNYGFWNVNNGTAVVHGASFTARGGTNAVGIDNHGSGTTLEAESVTAQGENGSDNNYGLLTFDGAAAMLRGSSFTARGGDDAFGIFNIGIISTLEAESVNVLAENGSSRNFGLYNWGGAAAVLYGGSFTGRGGDSTRGIENANNGSMLTAEGVTALAEDGSGDNYGFGSYDNVTTTLRGGSFTARGGTNTYGISNELTATLTAESVSALGETGSSNNYGLHSASGGATTLRGGSFTGRGGASAIGMGNFDEDTTLDAASVTALGEGGSSYSLGLDNGNSGSSATANVTQSVLEGATNSVVLGSGTITVSNSRLAGNAVSGAVTCVAVSRGGTFNPNGCP